MELAIASDHAGFELKSALIAHLKSRRLHVQDCGTDSTAPVDYPDYIRPAVERVADGRAELGIVLGGSGNGEAMVANRFRGIRCAVCWNVETARLAREHNDANVISIGARLVSEAEALRIVDAWLDASFEGGRHLHRIQKLDQHR